MVVVADQVAYQSHLNRPNEAKQVAFKRTNVSLFLLRKLVVQNAVVHARLSARTANAERRARRVRTVRRVRRVRNIRNIRRVKRVRKPRSVSGRVVATAKFVS